MRQLVRAGLVVVVGAAALVAPGLATAQAVDPAAAVRVETHAREGQGGTILGHLVARCSPGHVFQELTFEVTQNGFTSPGQQLGPIGCDGAWHRLAFTSFDGFDPGRAVISARLTVIDGQSGDPAPQAVDSAAVWVRPAAKVTLPSGARVSHGAVALWVNARCDRPWVEPDLAVSVGQGQVGATGVVTRGQLTCDGRWHLLRLRAAPVTGAFHRGRVDVLAYLTVYDPESFDPVAQASASRSVAVG